MTGTYPCPTAAVELKTRAFEPQTVKQQLAALRHLFDWLVTGQVLATNPAGRLRPRPEFIQQQGQDADRDA